LALNLCWKTSFLNGGIRKRGFVESLMNLRKFWLEIGKEGRPFFIGVDSVEDAKVLGTNSMK